MKALRIIARTLGALTLAGVGYAVLAGLAYYWVAVVPEQIRGQR